ncbi:MAG: arsenical pump-driving ATPase GET3, partial [Acidobacteriota bacterium]|nr:arsenical pump-driving ATPase GET3 [Acidobacteriota bacterium]
ERMGLEETVRLARSLRRLEVPMRRLLINNVVPRDAAEGCDFCGERRASQGRVIKDFRRKLGKTYDLFTAPEQPHEVRGAGRLREHFRLWKALE